MSKSSEIGRIGENIACEYLKSKKYRVLGRNIRVQRDEIDIVCREKKFRTLVFVEVKCLTANNVFKPEDHFGREKARKFSRAVQLFAGKHRDLIDEGIGYRVDLIAIEISDPLLTNWRKDCVIRHYKNVLA